MKEDISAYIASCKVCQKNKKPYRSPRAELGQMTVGAPLDRLSTDILGPLPETPRGNKYILTATDHFSNWVEIIPIPDLTAATTARVLLNEVIGRYGCPDTILSDEGRNYESKIFQELCQLLEIKKKRTTPRHPQCNGKTERFNRTLLKMIKSYIKNDRKDWDLYLGCMGAAYRSSVHESTGVTPNLIMLGREVRIPSEIVFGSKTRGDQPVVDYGEYIESLRDRLQRAHEIARKHLMSSTERQRHFYNLKTFVNNYKSGDKVWVLNESNTEKLSDCYWGPCTVVQKLSDLTYKIKSLENHTEKVVHHDKLKPYYD